MKILSIFKPEKNIKHVILVQNVALKRVVGIRGHSFIQLRLHEYWAATSFVGELQLRIEILEIHLSKFFNCVIHLLDCLLNDFNGNLFGE